MGLIDPYVAWNVVFFFFIKIARENGKYKGCKAIAADVGNLKKCTKDGGLGRSGGRVETMRELGLKPSAFCRWVKDYENSGLVFGLKLYCRIM